MNPMPLNNLTKQLLDDISEELAQAKHRIERAERLLMHLVQYDAYREEGGEG